MELQLKKPIAFIDLETTGINVGTDRIIELTVLRVDPNGKETIKTLRVNPTIPIPQESTEIHGISDADVANAPTFKEIAAQVIEIIDGCDLAGFNSNKFDFPLLAEELIRADADIDLKKRRFVDVQVIFHKMEQRTLSAAYKFYCGKDLVDAHSSEADTVATYEILKCQLDKYPELNNDIAFLDDFSSHKKHADFAGRIVYDDDGIEIFNFGKYKGEKVHEVLSKDPGYYGWMINGDFPLYTKKVLTNIKLKNFNK